MVTSRQLILTQGLISVLLLKKFKLFLYDWLWSISPVECKRYYSSTLNNQLLILMTAQKTNIQQLENQQNASFSSKCRHKYYNILLKKKNRTGPLHAWHYLDDAALLSWEWYFTAPCSCDHIHITANYNNALFYGLLPAKYCSPCNCSLILVEALDQFKITHLNINLNIIKLNFDLSTIVNLNGLHQPLISSWYIVWLSSLWFDKKMDVYT